MNLQSPRDPWSRLAAAARTVRDERDDSAPYGFSTRVAALAFAQERSVVSVFDRFALRALGVACLLALGSFAMNYNAISLPATPGTTVAVSSSDDFDVAAPTDDAVALVFDVAD